MSTSQSQEQTIKPTAEEMDQSSNAATTAGDSSSSAAGSGKNAEQQHCTNCKKPELDPEENPLKPCNKCYSVRYCGRDCQKADFKAHKKICAKEAQVYAQNAPVKMAAAPSAPKGGHRGGLQKWQFDT